jgi:hypothetical protein
MAQFRSEFCCPNAVKLGPHLHIGPAASRPRVIVSALSCSLAVILLHGYWAQEATLTLKYCRMLQALE